MRISLTDGRWYDSESAIHVSKKLRYTRLGNWVYHRLAHGVEIMEYEAVEIILSEHGCFDKSPGFAKLPQDVQAQLETYLDDEYPPYSEA